MPLDLDAIRQLIEAAVAGASLLAGTMAWMSGSRASEALDEGEGPAVVAQRINEGIARGFEVGAIPAFLALLVVLWS